MKITEYNGEIYFDYIGVLEIIFGTYLFPDITELKAYRKCKKKLEYICYLLATRGYCKNTKEAMKEIKKLKTMNQVQEYVEKIKNVITPDDIKNILMY